MSSNCPFRLRNCRALDQLPRWVIKIAICALLAGAAFAGTFGTVVPIGGHASDLALDEARGVVYVANYTANRIDVISTGTQKIQTSINVAKQPSSLSLSPDGRWLVIAHLSNFAAPNTYNGLTVLDLAQNTTQTFTFGAPPLGVVFGYDGLCLVVTTTDFVLLDPATGYTRLLKTLEQVATTSSLPVPTPQHPREIIRASISPSGNLKSAWGTLELGSPASFVLFKYDAVSKEISPEAWTATPILGPRVVSVNKTGSRVISGWAMWLDMNGWITTRGTHRFVVASFPITDNLASAVSDVSGKYDIGSHAIDSDRGIVYAQVPDSTWTDTMQSAVSSTLVLADEDNLTVRETLRLQENLSGRSVLSSDGNVMYSVSESGVTILPVGSLNKAPRVIPKQEDVVFRGQWCDRGVLVQNLEIVDPGGNKTDFVLTPDLPGVTVEPKSGTTPATVQVSIDMNAFQNNKGTTTSLIKIDSGAGVNVPPTVRVLINNREPDQRGTFLNIPGRVVDITADPVRNRFYVLRQDKNQVQVFDANNYKQIATLRTGTKPWSMAVTADRKYLITTADQSQCAHVFDLDKLQFSHYIVFPSGHWPRSVAASGHAILAASRLSGGGGIVDQIQLVQGIATALPSLGVWNNSVDVDTALTASPTGSSILMTQPDGTVMLYNANIDTFVLARKDVPKLSGVLAALSDDTFIADNLVLNASLFPMQQLETASGASSGFAMVDGLGLRTTAPSAASAGVIQRFDFKQSAAVRPTRMTEAPLLGAGQSQYGSVFTRTLTPLPNRNAILSLTTSGVTVLPWNYDAAVASPKINSIASAADQSASVAPGGLFSISGSDLSPINLATNQIPLPTALGDSCMTINGALVPMVFVSPNQINGQIPFEISGDSTMILRTPAGVSNNFKFTVQPQAPSVFQAEIPGLNSQVATVVRADNNEVVTAANPIHPDDWIIVYATGLGSVTPAVKSGNPGPADPLAEAMTQPELTLGKLAIPVAYAGLAPGQVGVYQINAKIPFKNVPDGMSVPLTIKQGAYSTTVNVRVVKP